MLKNYKKIGGKKNPKAWNASTFFFFPLPLSWKGSHKTLKLNWKGFGLGLIVELNKYKEGWINYTDLLYGDSGSK